MAPAATHAAAGAVKPLYSLTIAITALMSTQTMIAICMKIQKRGRLPMS
jgi:hypothetical protein